MNVLQIEHLAKHLEMKHTNDLIFSCGECRKKYGQLDEVKEHVKGHDKPVKFSCSRCTSAFLSSAEILSHVTDKHSYPNHHEEIDKVRPDKMLKCAICCAVTNSSKSLLNHCQIKHKIYQPKTVEATSSHKTPTIPVKVIPKVVKISKELSPTKLTCEICRQRIGNKTMGKHLLFFHANKNLSTDFKPFRCGACQTDFHQIRGLILHKCRAKILKKMRRCVCTLCLSIFNTPKHLGNHFVFCVEKKPFSFQCGICSNLYYQLFELCAHLSKDHKNSPEGTLPFQCGFCKEKFLNKCLVKRHIKARHKESEPEKQLGVAAVQEEKKTLLNKLTLKNLECTKQFKCGICGILCCQISEFNDHIEMVHKNFRGTVFKYQCGICEETFLFKDLLLAHFKAKHAEIGECQENHCTLAQKCLKPAEDPGKKCLRGDGLAQCPDCPKMFIDQTTLESHFKRTHSDAKRNQNFFRCGQCSKDFSQMQQFKSHLSDTHGDNRDKICLECCLCELKFTKIDLFVLHYQVTHKQVPAASLIFKEANELSDTSEKTLQKSSFECTLCKAKYSDKSKLDAHTDATHLNKDLAAKPFKCGMCKLSFGQIVLLDSHLKTFVHKVITMSCEPFECALCHANFSKKDPFIDHYKVEHSSTKSESQEKKIEGQVTSEALVSVKQTKEIHPFQCGLCNKQFSELKLLESHLEEVHKHKVYTVRFTCGLCSLKFMKKEMLVRHLKIKHTEVLQDVVPPETETDNVTRIFSCQVSIQSNFVVGELHNGNFLSTYVRVDF